MPSREPLIVTLSLDAASQQRFDALRRAHLPPERLVVGAHLTMFHAIPGALEDELRVLLGRCAKRPSFDVTVQRWRYLGGPWEPLAAWEFSRQA